jgi:hypothetical protein
MTSALAYPLGAHTESDVLELLEREILDAFVAGDGIDFAADVDLVFKAHAFAFAVLYGVNVIGFEPTTHDEERAVDAATYIVASWMKRRAKN